MNRKDVMIEITENGTCLAVWSDDNPLQMLGDLQVTWLSDVEFNHDLQGWEVTFRNGVKLPALYKERIQALNAEMTYVDEHLSEFGEWVKRHFPERQPTASPF
jgi:hypothetical protein